MNPFSGNPNAAVGAGSTVIGGQIVVNIAKLFGWNLSTGWGIFIAGIVSYIVLFVGREGLVGIKNLILHGTKGKAAAPTTLAPKTPPPPAPGP